MMIYVCRIELDEITPKIWREFRFHPELTFHQLHHLIQEVMGWGDYHLYEFQVNKKSIGVPDPEMQPFERGTSKELDARKEIVQKHVSMEGANFSYLYDFGDGWEHTITLKSIDMEQSDPVPVCLDGARACPPEDVGGVWGYQHLLEVLGTPDHPEREEMLEWAGEEFDPEHFSVQDTNVLLRQMKDKLIPKPAKGGAGSKKITGDTAGKPAKLTKTALNKHLKQLSNEQLIGLVKDCFGVSKDMEKFLSVRILGEEAAESLFEEYRKKVENEFFPDRGQPKLRLQEAKKAIAEFEKLTGSMKHVFELKLIYVESGVDFTVTYGDIDERFYRSMVSVYADVIGMANEDPMGELLEEYGDRLQKIVTDTEGIGWGFQDALVELHAELDRD
ncbi:plasmid pRiA4b ORF-3 family protein [Paenibacillus soyae]|uniref:Plasmid pRiA4b ORF-3 family protein n=1 Tax=Paenibacillus soyae TaxID=2969249 RepID=A0A9X2SAG5_9BACL|nr:plasmid pRiA4b ORF-3 family protein [Paenibacillus soyae]MCR2806256.1 plasmid pRiA4b ORF-3 family protein [Paenibacillus soyae]